MATRRRVLAVPAALVMVAAMVWSVPATAAGPRSGPGDGFSRLLTQDRESGLRSRLDRPRTSSAHHRSSATRSAVPSAEFVALDRSTDTLYVPGGADDGTLFVVDARTCNAERRACAAAVATTSSGHGPTGVVVDPATHTAYLAYADDGTVAVIDGRHCNVHDTSGCSRTPAALINAEGTLGLAIHASTRTLYLGSFVDRVSVIDLRTCNATTTSGCASPVASFAADGPAFPTVDAASDTLYLPENGPGTNGEGTTLALVDLRTCHAPAARSCGVVARAPMAHGPVLATVDQRTGTVFVTAQNDNAVSVIDGYRCNAHDTSGCAAEPVATVPTKLDPNGLAIDPVSRTLFVASLGSDTVGAIDLRHCSARHPAGCAATPPTRATGGLPSWLLVDPATHTLYAAESADGYLSAYDARSCSAASTRGCRREAPTAAGNQFGNTLDPLRHTLYSAVQDTGQLSLLDTNRCNADRLSGCALPPTPVNVGKVYGTLMSVPASHTLYAYDGEGGQLDVIDTATCNVTRTTGCAPVASLPISDTSDVWVNQRTGTAYATRDSGDVSVFDSRTCSALDHSGCSLPLLTIHVADGLSAAWIDEATNTFYVATSDDAVALLPGEACDRRSADCAVIARTRVGAAPIALSGDPSTHTAYVTNADFDHAGTVSIIDTRHCSARDRSGCGQAWPTIATARSPFGIVLDARSRTLFVTNLLASRVTLIDASRCNALDQRGCGTSLRQIATGQITAVTRLDPVHKTAYVLNSFDRTESVISTAHPCRSGLCFR